jgi:hypothetical protein
LKGSSWQPENGWATTDRRREQGICVGDDGLELARRIDAGSGGSGPGAADQGQARRIGLGAADQGPAR